MNLHITRLIAPNLTNYNKDLKIHIQKTFNKILNESKKSFKKDFCAICKKKINSYHNSHSVPRFSLQKISKNGYVLTDNIVHKLDTLKSKEGIKSAGTFRYICTKCDQDFFKTYENLNNYKEPDFQRNMSKILLEIGLKNHLFKLYQELISYEIYKQTFKYLSKNISYLYLSHSPYSIKMVLLQLHNDSSIIKKKIIKAQKKLDKLLFAFENEEYPYKLIFYKKLNYITPLAIQESTLLFFNLNGNIINDIFIEDNSNDKEFLHIAILPLLNETHIFLFTLKENEKYDDFSKNLNQLDSNNQLSIINYMIFLYTTNYFLAPQLLLNVEQNKKIEEASSLYYKAYWNNNKNVNNYMYQLFNLNNHKYIDNFLNKKFSIKT